MMRPATPRPPPMQILVPGAYATPLNQQTVPFTSVGPPATSRFISDVRLVKSISLMLMTSVITPSLPCLPRMASARGQLSRAHRQPQRDCGLTRAHGSFQQIQFLRGECQGVLDRVVVEFTTNLTSLAPREGWVRGDPNSRAFSPNLQSAINRSSSVRLPWPSKPAGRSW
jgi:hypothetical protein